MENRNTFYLQTEVMKESNQIFWDMFIIFFTVNHKLRILQCYFKSIGVPENQKGLLGIYCDPACHINLYSPDSW